MAKRIQVGGRIESKEVGGIVTGAADILDDAKGKKQSVINGETDDELARLDQSKQDNLTFDNAPTEGSDNPVKSGGLYAAQQAILLAIAAINELIPSAASALNQLADKAFVNSSISTNTATFRGTSAAGLNEQQFLAWANGLEHDLNDYVFWQTSDAAGNTLFKRYKWNGTEWRYEYTLNNSTFTAEQWEAIQSGITALLVAKLRALPTAEQLIQSFDSKQDVLTFDNVPTLGSTNPVKSSGIFNAIKEVSDVLDTFISETEALIPAEATAQNQLADKADVAAKIVAAIPSWKGQYDALTDLQAVTGAKAGDMGCVKTTDSDGHAVLTFYQYSAQGAWVVYYTLHHYAQNKPATTGTTGDYPYNGMGRIEIQKNIVNGVNTLTQAMLTQQNTIYVIQYDFTLGEDITVPANCVLEFDGGNISGEHTIYLSDNCIIEGNGSVLKAKFTASSCTSNTILASSNANNIIIRNIVFDGDYDGTSSASGNYSGHELINITNCSNVNIDNCIIRNYHQSWGGTHNVMIVSQSNNVNVCELKLYNVYPESPVFTDCEHLYISNYQITSDFSTWTGLHIFFCDDVILENSHIGVDVSQGSTINCTAKDVIIRNCEFYGGEGLDFSNETERQYIPSNILVSNCIINDSQKFLYCGPTKGVIDSIIVTDCIYKRTNGTVTNAFDVRQVHDFVLKNSRINTNNILVYYMGTTSEDRISICGNDIKSNTVIQVPEYGDNTNVEIEIKNNTIVSSGICLSDRTGNTLNYKKIIINNNNISCVNLLRFVNGTISNLFVENNILTITSIDSYTASNIDNVYFENNNVIGAISVYGKLLTVFRNNVQAPNYGGVIKFPFVQNSSLVFEGNKGATYNADYPYENTDNIVFRNNEVDLYSTVSNSYIERLRYFSENNTALLEYGSRPSYYKTGKMFLVTNGIPIWWTGSAWINAQGQIV